MFINKADAKVKLLRKAAAAHVEYIKNASQGQGVDRHLLGLRCVMKPGETSTIFTHPVFAKSQKWQLSTSALFFSDRVLGTGFGTVVSLPN
jgi:carnitine O-acetyltransferase